MLDRQAASLARCTCLLRRCAVVLLMTAACEKTTAPKPLHYDDLAGGWSGANGAAKLTVTLSMEDWVNTDYLFGGYAPELTVIADGRLSDARLALDTTFAGQRSDQPSPEKPVTGISVLLLRATIRDTPYVFSFISQSVSVDEMRGSLVRASPRGSDGAWVSDAIPLTLHRGCDPC